MKVQLATIADLIRTASPAPTGGFRVFRVMGERLKHALIDLWAEEKTRFAEETRRAAKGRSND